MYITFNMHKLHLLRYSNQVIKVLTPEMKDG